MQKEPVEDGMLEYGASIFTQLMLSTGGPAAIIQHLGDPDGGLRFDEPEGGEFAALWLLARLFGGYNRMVPLRAFALINQWLVDRGHSPMGAERSAKDEVVVDVFCGIAGFVLQSVGDTPEVVQSRIALALAMQQ